jgi:23S rRNA (uracil1939-C5)-methyltransferase
VTVESLGAGGTGVAHLADGMIVFVPRTAPGDRVRLRDVRRRRRHAGAQVAEVLEPGPGRVDPPCAHFTGDRCGGCQWQHVADTVQLEAKGRIVGDALRRIGGLDVPDPDVVPSPRPFGYRTTMTLTVRWRGAHAIAGFHDQADPDRVFMLRSCPIAREELNALWAAIGTKASALPHGDDVRLKLRLARDGSRHVVVEGGEGAWMGGERLAEALRAGSIEPATVWWQPRDGAIRRVAGSESDAAAVGFEQVNAEVAALLREAVIDGALPAGRVLDFYAGAGDTAVPLAERGCDVAMVEIDARAVRRAEARAGAAGVTMRCIAGRVEDHVAKLLPADAVIVNPPRTGLSDEVIRHLGDLPSCRLVYVSCDPATLARDLKRLRIGAGRIRTLRAFDMFPQTSHVETLVVAEPAAHLPAS